MSRACVDKHLAWEYAYKRYDIYLIESAQEPLKDV